MVNVHDWINTKKAPANPTAEDMRYGVGCLNDFIVILTEKMTNLLHNDGQYKNYDAERLMDELEQSTFGHQMTIIRKHCKGFDITFDKMNQLRENRNYFDHNFNTRNFSISDAHRLSASINMVQKLIGQLSNANAKAESKIKTSNNIKNDSLRKAIIQIVHKIPQDQDGDVLLSEVGNRLKKAGHQYDSRLIDIIVDYGWRTMQDQESKVHYLRVREIR